MNSKKYQWLPVNKDIKYLLANVHSAPRKNGCIEDKKTSKIGDLDEAHVRILWKQKH